MKIRRRPLQSAPLLSAVGATAAMIIGCMGEDPEEEFTTGNLVAPPPVSLCVEVTPADAAVTLNGLATPDDGCLEFEDGQRVTVQAAASGYADYSAEVTVAYDMGKHEILLTPAEGPGENDQPKSGAERQPKPEGGDAKPAEGDAKPAEGTKNANRR